MVSPARVLTRPTAFGEPLDSMIDEIMSRLNTLETPAGARAITRIIEITKVIPATPESLIPPQDPNPPAPVIEKRIVNSGETNLIEGSVLGFDSSTDLVYATATLSAAIRPVLITIETVAPGGLFVPKFIGYVRLRIESGITPSRGDPCYLSASEAGTVRDSTPTGHKFFLIGQFASEKSDIDGRADVFFIPNLSPSQSLP